MDIRIRQAFTEVWKLYQENYDIHPKDSYGWDKLLQKAAEIYERYKDLAVVMGFLSVILDDIDSRSVEGEIEYQQTEKIPLPNGSRGDGVLADPVHGRCRDYVQ